jgi:GNAT superfamily N-acetyltransferase
MIRTLHPETDRARVDAFFQAAAEYIRLERDEDPGPAVTDEFFTDAPPGQHPADSHRLGLFRDDHLIAVAEMAFNYPEPGDAYLGLMIVIPSARGTGAGQILLRHLETVARSNGAARIYLAVLDANPRGRAFWERQGFTLALADRPVTLGQKTQIAHRLVKQL